MPDSTQQQQAAELDADFAQRIKQRRDYLGWTQTQLAEKLTEAGLPMRQQVVQRIEAEGENRRPVRFGEAITIARVLGISLDALVQADDAPTIVEELQEAAFQAERISRSLEDQARALRGAQANYERALERAQTLSPSDILAQAEDGAELELESHAHRLDRLGPVYSVERQVVHGILRHFGAKTAPLPGPESIDANLGELLHWANSLRAAWALYAFTGQEKPHWRKDAERLIILHDAMGIVQALDNDYDTALESLREKGYWLDSEVLELSGLSSLKDDTDFQ